MEAGSGDRPPRPPPPQQPPTAPLEVDGSTPSTGRRRRLLGPSMQTLAGATMEDLQGDLPIQAKLQGE